MNRIKTYYMINKTFQERKKWGTIEDSEKLPEELLLVQGL